MKLHLTLIAVCLSTTASVPASAPDWWDAYGVIDTGAVADDFAVLNQGQIKHLATHAAAYLDVALEPIGGAGPAVQGLVGAWSPGPHPDNVIAINLGQLKNVSKPFYDRLIAIGYTAQYPWAGGTPDDFALANIGQAKNLFAFDLSSFDVYAVDSDGSGLPDWWQLKYFGTLGVDPNADASGDGRNNLLEFQDGTNPLDYYNIGHASLEKQPLVAVAAGDGQFGESGVPLTNAVVLQVRDAHTNDLLSNAPIYLTVQALGALLDTDPAMLAAQADKEVRSDANGEIHFYIQP